ncbi:MAG: electron transfer flavoprotein subunit alpha/FixB family protein [Anaerolineaceae bacterium]|nr:electron transfer flavoprotein subunit alpha/FixB family protein [Anaerolineaceae bacterium]
MSEHRDVWTLSESRNGKLHPVSFELLAWGRSLADALKVKLCAVVLGSKFDDAELEKLIAHGADQVRVVDDPALASFRVRPHSGALETLVRRREPEILIAAATSTGRSVLPYLSIKVHAGLTADCTGLEIDPETGLLLQTRPAIGGNIMATIKTPEARPQMATVRPKSARPLPPDPARQGEIIREEIPAEILHSDVEELAYIENEGADENLDEADVIVAGGRALKSADNFALLSELAHLLGGTIGASRVPVDYGWQPYPRQIGLSGKTISPALYIACGISGSIQHLAGIQTAEHIVAINKDPDAQIFQVADLGIIGDLYEILPALIERLREENSPISPNHSQNEQHKE